MKMSMPVRAAPELNRLVYWSGEMVLISGLSPMAVAAAAVAWATTSEPTETGLVAMTIFWPSTPASCASSLARATS